MSAVATPCETNPEDWFIERDGKQYRDDDLLEDRAGLARSAALEQPHIDSAEVLDRLEAEAKRAALIRRRKARDACHFECPVRLRCLALGLQPENQEHGTYGGYYPEERQKIQELIDDRAAKRAESQEE